MKCRYVNKLQAKKNKNYNLPILIVVDNYFIIWNIQHNVGLLFPFIRCLERLATRQYHWSVKISFRSRFILLNWFHNPYWTTTLSLLDGLMSILDKKWFSTSANWLAKLEFGASSLRTVVRVGPKRLKRIYKTCSVLHQTRSSVTILQKWISKFFHITRIQTCFLIGVIVGNWGSPLRNSTFSSISSSSCRLGLRWWNIIMIWFCGGRWFVLEIFTKWEKF